MKTTCENCNKAINTLVDFFTISGEDFHHCEACSQEDTDQEWGDLYHEMDDVEADADTLKSAGWGTDEDYGGTDERLQK